jgi:hypothetical protein
MAGKVFSVADAQWENRFFTDSRSAELKVIGGSDFLNATLPKEVNSVALGFGKKWSTQTERMP